MPSSKTRVAIVGAGVAGLVVARQLSAREETFTVVVFEQSEHIGGTWVYTDETDFDKYRIPIHSSMYQNLRTNLPKEIMQIPDFPFKNKGGPSFVHHSVIRDYLKSYAKHFSLYQYIKLCTIVDRIEPEKLSNGQTIWQVSYTDLKTKVTHTKTFDAVILGNGHYSVGNVPHINGIETFCGGRAHSHQYRMPEKYANKRVCILGASWSGIDIALEVSKHAKKIYLSHNLPEPLDAKLPSNIEQRPGIDHVIGNNFAFTDGSTVEVDDLLYCTGYKFTYPFMSSKVKLITEDNHVYPVYKHIIHMDMPNLFFLGLPDIGIPFPTVSIQAQYILGVLEGRVKLPSREKMYDEYEKEKQELLGQGVPLRHFSKIGGGKRQWEYYDELAMAAGFSSFAPVVRKIYSHVNKMREQDFTTYKNYLYRIVDQENFTVDCCSVYNGNEK